MSYTGTIPDTIYENSAIGDWVAYLTFSNDVLSAGLVGTDAGRFVTTFRSGSRLLTITPAAAFDAEQFAPDFVFSVRLTIKTTAGWNTQPGSYSIQLLNLDDTAPANLRFRSGGVVLDNDVGAPIGLLAADDPDSAGALEYSVAWPDSALFEVVGTELRLRQGVSLLGLGGTTRDVLIEVSDGLNMAAQSVSVTILATDPPSPFAIQDGTLLANVLFGSERADAIFAHDGADTIYGLGGADSLDGGAGNDVLQGGSGDDTLLSQAGNDFLFGGDGNDLIIGDDGNDWLDGGAGNDSLEGGSGADTLDGGTGINTLVGGAGNDVFLLRSQSDQVIEFAGGGIDEIEVAWSMTIPAEIERLRLRIGAGKLNATGSDRDDWLFGNERINILVGGLGNDWLDGGASADTLNGDAGNDTLLGGTGDDSLSGGDGADSALGGDGQDRIAGDAGDDSLSGGAGNDLILGQAGQDRLEGGTEDDRLAGGDGDDTILGDAGNDLLSGGAGADSLDGGAGNDTLYGGADNDTLWGGAGRDVLDGGAGADTLDGGAGDDDLQGGAGDDLLRGGGGAGDVLRGGAGADTLDAASGDHLGSRLFGGPGDDIYLVDSRSDEIIEAANEGLDTVRANLEAGGYRLPANVENLFLLGTALFGQGNDLANQITGNAFDNLLIGEAGADTLRGGGGDDTLLGGPGADRFIIDASSGFDTIADFAAGADRIMVPALVYSSIALILSHLDEVSSGSYLTLGTGGLSILNLSPIQLHAADFILF